MALTAYKNREANVIIAYGSDWRILGSLSRACQSRCVVVGNWFGIGIGRQICPVFDVRVMAKRETIGVGRREHTEQC
jgi:hypothetical protein